MNGTSRVARLARAACLCGMLTGVVSGCGGSGEERNPAEATPALEPTEAPATNGWASERSPQLVLSVVVEALDSETLTRLLPALPEHGFIRRAIREGAHYPHAELPFAATYSAAAHATLYTGATPRLTGIVADALRDPEPPGPPRVRTVADALREATASTGKVVSLALAPGPAWSGVGHRARGGWAHHVERGRYVPLGPAWDNPEETRRVRGARDTHLDTARYLDRWLPHDESFLAQFAGTDQVEGELDWQGLGTAFPRDPRRSPLPSLALHATPRSTESLLALAARRIQEDGLGQDDIPDLLSVTIGATGVAARAYGVHSWEYLDNLVAADLLLAELVTMLAERGPVAVLLTSDCGVVDLPERHREHHRVDPEVLRDALDDGLDVLLERRIAWVDTIIPPYVYLTRGAPFRVDEAVTAAIRFLEGRPEVLRAYAVDAVPSARDGGDETDALVRESVTQGLGGEIYVVPREGYVFDTQPARGGGTGSGGITAREREVPILLVGAGVVPGETEARVDIRRYAPTLSALLGVPRPPASRLPPLRAARPSPLSALPGRVEAAEDAAEEAARDQSSDARVP
ncbi:MAG: alkaline phosphatase family protein [Polyangiales bacterium]